MLFLLFVFVPQVLVSLRSVLFAIHRIYQLFHFITHLSQVIIVDQLVECVKSAVDLLIDTDPLVTIGRSDCCRLSAFCWIRLYISLLMASVLLLYLLSRQIILILIISILILLIIRILRVAQVQAAHLGLVL